MLIYNSRCSIYRDNIVDDDFGGAIVTGTIIICQNEPCRLDYIIPKVNLIAPQGIETTQLYNALLRSTHQHPINVRENDYFILTFPTLHKEYNNRMRVRGVQLESLHPQDPNSIISLDLIRIRESRNNSVD